MTDPDEFMHVARWTSLKLAAAGKSPPYNPIMRTLFRLLLVQAVLLPLMVEKDGLGGWMFQLHPEPMKASPRAWCWLWPVRSGYELWMFEMLHGTNRHCTWQDYHDRCERDAGYRARMECLCGETIWDVAAFSLDFSKCYGRLNEQSAVIGYPVQPEISGKAVRLFRSVRKWLDGKCEGAALIGSDFENEAWMRGCEHGIITDDVAHGKYVQKILQRPYAGPQILVAA